MKLKGISFIEQHVEKIVLGVFILAALVMVALQFLTPSTVKVQSKQLPLDAAYEEAISEASRLQGRLRSTDMPEGIPAEVPDLSSLLRDRLDDPVASAERLAAPLGFVATPREGSVVGPELPEQQFARIEPPAPMSPIASAYAATLDPIVVETVPGLKDFVPAEQPFDVRAVSVQATFPASQLAQWLDSDPDGAGPYAAYPKFLWMGRLAIVDIQLERQEMSPSGEYSEPAPVPPTPGLQTTRNALASADLTRAVYQSVIAGARETERNAIVRPAFLPTIAGEPWTPPSAQPVALGGPVEAAAPGELERLRKLLEDKKKELQQVTDELDKPAAAPATQGRTTRGQSVSPGGGGGGQNREERGPSAEERRRENLQKRRDKLQTDIAEMEASIGKLTGGADPEAAADDLSDQPAPQLDEGKDFDVWAHDLTAKPGATYRYRMRVVVSNPLFGDRNRPGEPAMIEGGYSEWTAPVTVEPETMIFFTSAQVGIEGQVGPKVADASADVFTFFYGYWRKASVRLSPGDAIAASVDLPELPYFRVGAEGAVEEGGAPDSIEVATDAFMVDVVETSSEAGFGQPKSVLQVVYRDADGRLLSRLPEVDKGSNERLAAEAAAQAGLTGEVRAPGAEPLLGAAPTTKRPAADRGEPGDAQTPATQPGAAPPGRGPGRVN